MQPDSSRFALYALCIFAISFAGGLVPLVRRWTKPQLRTLIGLSAGIILGVLVVVDREQGGRAAVEKSGLSVVALTTTHTILGDSAVAED